MLKKIINSIESFSAISALVSYSKRLTLPFFDRMPLYDVITFFFKGLLKGSLTTRASSLAFNFFLALFPTILVFFTIIPFIPIFNFQDTLLNLINNLLPPGTYGFVSSTIEDIVARKQGSWLSVGFVLALVFSTNGISSIIDAFNNTYHSIESHAFWKQFFVSMILVLVVSFLLIVTIALITFQSMVLQYLVDHELLRGQLTPVLLKVGTWIAIVLMLFTVYSILYFFGTVKKMTYKFISAGSTLATLLSIFSYFGFNYYVSNFSRYNALYGSIGTLIILLLWIYFNAIILLIGFELNASIFHAKRKDKLLTKRKKQHLLIEEKKRKA